MPIIKRRDEEDEPSREEASSRRWEAIADRRTTKRRGPQSIGELVAELLTRRGLGRKLANQDQASAWREAVGEELAEMTRPGPVRRGVLEVTVAHSTLIQELTFEKAEILARLKETMGQGEINDLRFRVGSVDS